MPDAERDRFESGGLGQLDPAEGINGEFDGGGRDLEQGADPETGQVPSRHEVVPGLWPNELRGSQPLLRRQPRERHFRKRLRSAKKPDINHGNSTIVATPRAYPLP